MGANSLPQQLNIVVLNVATIFAEVDGDAIGSREFGEDGSGNRIRLNGAASLADGCDVVDVDTKSRQGFVLKASGNHFIVFV
jgi:hypothetical protein